MEKVKISEKYFEKVLEGKEKASIFALAKQRERGAGKEERLFRRSSLNE